MSATTVLGIALLSLVFLAIISTIACCWVTVYCDLKYLKLDTQKDDNGCDDGEEPECSTE